MGVHLKHYIMVSSKPPYVFPVRVPPVIDKIMFEIQTSTIFNDTKFYLFKLFHSSFFGGGGVVVKISISPKQRDNVIRMAMPLIL